MDLRAHLRRQFAYDAWANREVYAALKVSAQPSARSLRLLAHILSADRLWLERIKQQPQSLPVWPEFSLEQCGAQTNEIAELWREYMEQLSAPQLASQVLYKNTRGEPWTSSVEQIATHVILHSAYHRGQIAAQMRAQGNEPAYTDFIHAARQGLIE
jgi:uncharacterized damage-inducible protein DinB